MNERRSYSRQETRLRVEVAREGQGTEEGRTRNLSMVGLFLKAVKAHPVGTRVRLSLILPDDPVPVEVCSEVVHSIPGSGMGFRFDEFLADGEARLLGFLGPETKIS